MTAETWLLSLTPTKRISSAGCRPDALRKSGRKTILLEFLDDMVAITIEYQRDLRCKAVHGSSGNVLTTDAPKDNKGRGESFSPTDLVATALGSCILSVMGIGSTATVDKEMANVPVRMIRKLIVKVHVPGRLDEEHLQKLENAAHADRVYLEVTCCE